MALLTRHGHLLDSIRLASTRSDFRLVARRLPDLERLYASSSGLPRVSPPRVAVRQRVENLHSSRPTGGTREEAVESVRGDFLQREFLLLEVLNESGRDISSLVARRRLRGEAVWTKGGVWSSSSGGLFLPSGSQVACLPAGDTRLLAVAQCFKRDAMWARLGDPVLDLPYECLDRDGRLNGYCSPGGSDLSLGSEVELEIQLVADGFTKTYALRLSFVDTEPKVQFSPIPL